MTCTVHNYVEDAVINILCLVGSSQGDCRSNRVDVSSKVTPQQDLQKLKCTHGAETIHTWLLEFCVGQDTDPINETVSGKRRCLRSCFPTATCFHRTFPAAPHLPTALKLTRE
ncbi:hypothetical protein ISCGN_031607 [Ixodes scapularis]